MQFFHLLHSKPLQKGFSSLTVVAVIFLPRISVVCPAEVLLFFVNAACMHSISHLKTCMTNGPIKPCAFLYQNCYKHILHNVLQVPCPVVHVLLWRYQTSDRVSITCWCHQNKETDCRRRQFALIPSIAPLMVMNENITQLP